MSYYSSTLSSQRDLPREADPFDFLYYPSLSPRPIGHIYQVSFQEIHVTII